MKKMASAATITVFLLCCFCIASSDSQDVCDAYAATGTSFTVHLKYALKESDTLKWFKDSTVIFHRRNKKVIEGKNVDVDSAGSLKLTKLTKDKSGQYTPEVHSGDGKSVGDLQSLRLCVLDHVQKPKVTMKCTDSKAKVTFTCNVNQKEKDFTIEWLMDGKKLKEKEKTLTRVVKDVANARFSCKVSNPVSSEISGPVQQDCYKPTPVQKPQVTTTCQNKSDVIFTCTVHQKDDYMKFQWLNKDKKLEETGETLTKKVKDVLNTPFICNVSNHISFEISEPVIENCPNFSFPDNLFGISIWVFVGGGAGIFVLVILSVITCCIRTRRKKHMR